MRRNGEKYGEKNKRIENMERVSADEEKAKAALVRLCADNLPEYAQPIDFIFIEKMPLTDNGKIDFRILEDMERNR